MVLVQLECGSTRALGYTYADAGTAAAARKLLEEVVLGSNPFCHASMLQRMLRSIRNLGETGIAMMAVSAIDNAIWDLRARLLDIPLVSLLGQVRTGIPVYGSGGFTSYTDRQFTDQLGGWASNGFASVKMKIGTHPDKDPARVEPARKAIGDCCGLFVDANGAYTVTQAIELAQRFADQGVCWFEEPVAPIISSGSIRFASALRSAWILPPVNMATLVVLSLDARCAGCDSSAGRLHPLRRHQRLS